MWNWKMPNRKITLLLLASALVAAADVAKPADTRLADAAQRGDLETVRSLMQQNADVNGAQGDGSTALHWAASRGDAEIARLLIQKGAKTDPVTRIGAITPLLTAARSGSAAVVNVLLAAGADVNRANSQGTTALMMAAASGDAETVRVLIRHKADLNARELAHGQTAAMFAAALNRDAVLKVLAAAGADLNASTKISKLGRVRVDADGNTLPDAEEPAKPDDTKLTDPKPSDKANPADRTRPADAARASGAAAPPQGREFGNTVVGGMTALLFAARDGQTAAVQALIEAGADINKISDSDQTSPLVMAVLNGHLDIAKYLLDHNADPRLANSSGLTALYAAVDVQWAPKSWYPQPDTAQEKLSYLQLMDLLIAKGANVNAQLTKKLWYRGLAQDGEWADTAGSTALWRAAKANDLTAMRFLVSKGADPKIRSTQGATPLMMAAGLGWEGNYTSNSSETWLDSVKYLVELGSDVNAVDTRGYSSLHGAAYVGRNDIVEYLTSKGADPKVRSRSGMGTNGVNRDPGTKGDTTADMANGPREKSQVHPETVALLERLGSENSQNCRSNECLVLPVEDRKPSRPQTDGAKPTAPGAAKSSPTEARERSQR